MILNKFIRIFKNIATKRTLRKKNVHIGGVADAFSSFEGSNKTSYRSVVLNSRIGYGTYIGSGSRILNAEIGRYCSIGRDLDIIFATHPLYNCISTHPAFYHTSNYIITYVDRDKFKLEKFIKDNIAVRIGNDVWIGDNVTILGGVVIGNGAVLAANSVITKDIPRYAVAGGNPAKIIKYRFPEKEIAKLEELKWWDKPEAWIIENAGLFYNDDKEELMKAIRNL